MKNIQLKILFAICCIVIFPFGINEPHLRATETPTKIQVLELTDSWTDKNMYEIPSAVPTNLGVLNNAEVTRMTIKEFNASRFRLEGRFDIVVIGKSGFSTNKYSTKKLDVVTSTDTSVRKIAHNTSKIENDLTTLKYNQLNKLLNNKVSIIMHLDTKTNTGNVGKLYEDDQIIKVSDMTKATEIINSFKSVRPRLVSVDVSQGTTKLNKVSFDSSAKKNLPITFKISTDLSNVTSTMRPTVQFKLYIDFNSDDRFSKDEWVPSSINQNNELVWEPLGYSYTGPRNWMIEVVDGEKGEDYLSGSFLYVDQEVKAEILQITQKDTTQKVSRITSSNFMNRDQLLSRPGFYNFNVEEMTGTDFDVYSANLKDLKYNKYNPNAVSSLNERYDLLILGFKDVYKDYSLDDKKDGFKAIQDYIKTGQGVLMTHDTLYRSPGKLSTKTKWEDYFSQYAAQPSENFTNLGQGAPNVSYKATIVNEGILTGYPYQIDRNKDGSKKKIIDIQLTHNQYFQLNLEDEDVTAYYNMYGYEINSDKKIENTPEKIGRTIGDARNHYYIYSKGNVTYSGSGHVNLEINTPMDEKQLFSNTMYRAFIASNHKPKIEWAVDEKPFLNSNEFSTFWRAIDYDLADKKLRTTMTIYNGDNENAGVLATHDVVIDNDGKPVVSPALENIFKGKQGSFLVKIDATDRLDQPIERRAKATEKRLIRVIDDPNPIQIKRSIRDYKTFLTGEKVFIDYEINFSADNRVISKVLLNSFSEKIPSNLKILSVKSENTEIRISSKNDSDYQIDFSPITYSKIQIPSTSKIKWSVEVESKEEGEYILNQPELSGSWISVNQNPIQVSFNDLAKIIYKKPKILIGPYNSIYETASINLSEKVNILPINRIDEFKNLTFEIVDSGSSNASIKDGKYLKSDTSGVVQVRAVSEVFGQKVYSEPTNLIVLPIPTLERKEDVFVGQTKSFTIDLAGSKILRQSDPQPEVTFQNGSFTITPLTKGTKNIDFILENEKKELQRLRYVIDSKFAFLGVGSPVTIEKGETYERNIKFFSDDTLKSEVQLTSAPKLIFNSLSEALVIEDKPQLTFTGKMGTPNNDARIQVSYADSPNDFATLPVYVTEFPSLIQAKDMVLKIGEIKAPLITWNTPTATETNYRLDVISGTPFVKVESNSSSVEKDKYKITGLSKGLAKIKLTALTKTGNVLLKENKEISSTFFVLVEEGSYKDTGDRY